MKMNNIYICENKVNISILVAKNKVKMYNITCNVYVFYIKHVCEKSGRTQ